VVWHEKTLFGMYVIVLHVFDPLQWCSQKYTFDISQFPDCFVLNLQKNFSLFWLVWHFWSYFDIFRLAIWRTVFGPSEPGKPVSFSVGALWLQI